jgi:hypothetical protein
MISLRLPSGMINLIDNQRSSLPNPSLRWPG